MRTFIIIFDASIEKFRIGFRDTYDDQGLWYIFVEISPIESKETAMMIRDGLNRLQS